MIKQVFCAKHITFLVVTLSTFASRRDLPDLIRGVQGDVPV